MLQTTSLPVPPLAAGTAMRNFIAAPWSVQKLRRMTLRELSVDARRRLKWFEYYETNGGNASRTCRHFGISRSTFYMWRARYRPFDLSSLEDRSSRPKRCREKTWTTAEVLAVKAEREEHPSWGKLKLQVLLGRAGMVLSVSRVGRILGYLKRTGKLREPLRRLSARGRAWTRKYAVRKPKSYRPVRPGDLVQVDTVDLRPEPNVVLKQFTAVDVVSRWSVAFLAHDATAASATRALAAIRERMPFAVRAIQVDGGAEFMGVFEDAVATAGLSLFELPPRSPKLNGCVERTNRTYREDFYDCTAAPPTVAALGKALLAYETVYNTVRPHQALNSLTPAQFLASRFPEEALSGTS